MCESNPGCTYSRCGFNDVAYKKDSCCELPRACQDRYGRVTCTSTRGRLRCCTIHSAGVASVVLFHVLA